jgi:hypothetical protein
MMWSAKKLNPQGTILLSTVNKYQEIRQLVKNEGNPNSNHRDELQPRWTTAAEMETTESNGAWTDPRVCPVKMIVRAVYPQIRGRPLLMSFRYVSKENQYHISVTFITSVGPFASDSSQIPDPILMEPCMRDKY